MRIRALLNPVVSIAVVGFGLVSCGDDKKSTADQTTADQTTADTETNATDAVTTDAPTIVAEPTTTVVDEVAARVAAAEAIAGSYTGNWTNTTFASTGTIDAVFSVDAATSVVSLQLDLGGNVFGSPDPDGLIAEFDLNEEGPYTGTNELFGDFTITYEAGHLSFTAAAVPGVGNREMTLEGDLVDGAFSGTYTIVGLAEGTFEATRS